MATSKQTPPKLSVSIPMAKVNATAARLDAIVPNLASDLSPSLVYLPGADDEVVKNASVLTSADYGWTAPDLNNGQPYTVQIEVFGAGGGGGGGAATGVGGGGGGGGGEYACEPLYPIIPGETYSYFAGKGGRGGKTSSLIAGATAFPGFSGQPTQFDLRGKGLTGGVLANGGFGGDQSGNGLGGPGGTGSSNTIHFDGGSGATSSSGIMSDNPITGMANGIGHVFSWYRLDDAVGKTTAQDFSSARKAASVVVGSGAIVKPVSSPVAPPQVPFGPSQNWWGGTSVGETQGNCWQFEHGSGSGGIGGLVAPVRTPALTTLSVGAWIKGSLSASAAGDWTDGTHSSAIIATSLDASSTGASKGWMFSLGGGSGASSSTINFTGVRSDGSLYGMSATGPSATDGNWHYVVAEWAATGTNNCALYVDGVAVVTSTSTIGQIAASSKTISVGFNQATNSYGFKGYMSNPWVTTMIAPSSYVTAAYGATPATGGSGGGASGGSAGAGNAGTLATGSTGGAGGSSAAASNPGINTGSGAGGAGGNSNSAGGNAPTSIPYAGGGGGAGADTSAVPSAFSVEVPCSMSASYAGLDASGAAAGQLYTISANPVANETDPWYNTAAKQDAICYSGGASSAPFKGSMNTLLTFPSLASIDGNTGNVTDYLASGDWTIQKTYLKLTVETPHASVIVIGSWMSNAVISMLDSDATLGAWGYGGPLLTAYIPAGTAGRQVYIDLSGTTVISTMLSNAYTNGYSQNGQALQGSGLLIGALQGSTLYYGNVHGAWNADEDQDWYTAFHGADSSGLSAALEIYYTASGASVVTAGAGSDGYIVVRYLDPKGTPIATVLPEAAVDAGGNNLGAGFTADSGNYNVWQPGSNPRTLESWHAMTLVNGWTAGGGTSSYYRLLPGNLLVLKINVDAASSTNDLFFTLPVGWRPDNPQYGKPAFTQASINTNIYLQVASNGQLSFVNGHGVGTHMLGTFVISLDAPA
jgi:hypothetical protein